MKKILLVCLLSLPSFGAVALVQSKGGSGSTRCDTNGGFPSSLTCTFTSTPTVGNTVFVSATTYNTTMTAADNQGNTYTVVDHVQNGDLIHKYLFSAPVTTSSGSFTVTITVVLPSYQVMSIYEFSGLDNVALLDQHANATGTGSTQSVGPVTTTSANELIFMTCGSQTSATWSNNGGVWTQGEYHTGFSTTVFDWDQWRSVTSIQTSYTAAMDFTGSIPASCVLGTFNASGGGGGTTVRRRVVN